MNYSRNHMSIPWAEYDLSSEVPLSNEKLLVKSSFIGRIGLIMLSCGTTAWRIRRAMNTVAKSLNVSCVAEIGINTINYTCFSEHQSLTQSLSLEGIGVNTGKLIEIEKYVRNFPEKYAHKSIAENHPVIDGIDKTPHFYSPVILALAAAFACAGFIFNLGGGLPEIICVFIAAGCGNFVRASLNHAKISAVIGITGGAVTSCVVYALCMMLARALVPEMISYGAGYIGSVLYLVPGFPFITSIMDFGKLDMRSGIERLVFSLIVMAFATVFCWVSALVFGLDPAVGAGISMTPVIRIIFRLIASFAGVVGFSIIFNSPVKLALCAGVIGCAANTLRLELVDRTGISVVICSFIGAFIVGILAGFMVKKTGFPRVGITIPSVVVSVPGLFMYRAIYYIGTGDMSQGMVFFFKAAAIVFAIGLGVLFARFATDKDYRHKD